MPRPVWKGQVSFGLVNIPVFLYSAERRAELKFNLIDSRNRARVRYERINEVTGEEVPWSDIVKGYEYEEGNYVLLDEADFERAAVKATQMIEIEGFIDANAITAPYFDKPYYLSPANNNDKGYVLLRETLKSTGKIGIARVVIRTRQYLAALLPEGNALVLNLLRFEQELRDPEDYDIPEGSPKDYDISARELDMAERLVAAMEMEWHPEQYQDEYRTALMDWIDKKIRAGEFGPLPEEERPAVLEIQEAGDIMKLLQESVEKSAS